MSRKFDPYGPLPVNDYTTFSQVVRVEGDGQEVVESPCLQTHLAKKSAQSCNEFSRLNGLADRYEARRITLPQSLYEPVKRAKSARRPKQVRRLRLYAA
jgi:hypothetical protein